MAASPREGLHAHPLLRARPGTSPLSHSRLQTFHLPWSGSPYTLWPCRGVPPSWEMLADTLTAGPCCLALSGAHSDPSHLAQPLTPKLHWKTQRQAPPLSAGQWAFWVPTPPPRRTSGLILPPNLGPRGPRSLSPTSASELTCGPASLETAAKSLCTSHMHPPS